MVEWVSRSEWGRSEAKGPDRWDRKSRMMGGMPDVEFGNDPFLDLINRTADLNENMSVLDIGCGTGRYSIPIAYKVHNVVGLDFSPKMLEVAIKKALDNGRDNVSFLVDDWSKDRDDKLLDKDYDVVIAHLTPAIGSEASLRKMIDVSGGMCYLTMHLSVQNSINEGIDKILGDDPPDFKDKLLAALRSLWSMGYEPYLNYESSIQEGALTVEEAFEKYSVGHLRSRSLNEYQRSLVREYMESISEDGIIKERSDITTATIYWDVKRVKGL